MKNLNERCTLQNECGRKICKFVKKENQCEYYQSNSRPGYEIEDQKISYSDDISDESDLSEKPGTLVYIDVNKIDPHPQNPRKDLGDLTELADSIKKQGILQNLTVVPWFSKITGVGCDDPKQQKEMGYIAVIGHRRLAAAKLAGLKEVPCVISDMKLREQVATMLLENMQRNDLTIYEQAQGFQMMLDFGDSVNDIAMQTGFSETTVRRRVKLLELDQNKFKASVERGATLMDFAELDKIESLELRNSVLDKIGTPNFRNELQRVIDKQKTDKNIARIVTELEKFAVKVNESSGLQYVSSYYTSQEQAVTAPEDAGTVKYFFTVSSYYITLYKERSQTQGNTEEDPREKARRERQAALNEITKRAYQLRRDFVKTISNAKAKKSIGVIIEQSIKDMIDNPYDRMDCEDYAEFLGIELHEDEEWSFDKVAEDIRSQPERHLLITTYLTSDSINERYYNWRNQHEDNEDLNGVYNFLEKLGYDISDEERSMRDGTNELFQTEEGEQDA